MKAFRYEVVSVLALCLMAMTPQAMAQQAPKWQGHVEAEGKWGTERSLGEAGVVIPVWQNSDTLLFTDFRGRFDNQDSTELNLGLALRRNFHDKAILGSYVFYDRRRSPIDNVFHQATIGGEVLTRHFDLRVNGYIPENSKKDIAGTGGVAGDTSGGNIQINHFGPARERALPGFDAEVGAHFPLSDNWRVSAWGGGFYFDADGYAEVSGPRGRAEVEYQGVPYLGEDSRLTLGVERQHDNVRGTQTFALARLRVPFSALGGRETQTATLSALDRRMTDRIYRDIDVVSGTSAPQLLDTEAATVTLTGGTQVSGYVMADTADLQNSLNTAGANSLVVVDGGSPIITTGLTLQNGQTLAGGGAQMTATGMNSGTQVTVTLPGQRPVLQGLNGGVSIVTMADASGLVNVSLLGGQSGVVSVAKTDTYLEDVDIALPASFGVSLTGAGSGTAKGLSITDAGAPALLIFQGVYEMEDVFITSSLAPAPGIYMDILSSLTLRNSLISDVEQEGILIDGGAQMTAYNTTVRRTGRSGIYVKSISRAKFYDGLIEDTGDNGVMVENASALTMEGSTIRNFALTGVANLGSSVSVIRDSTIRDGKDINGSEGIISTAGGILDLSNVNIINPGAIGLDISNSIVGGSGNTMSGTVTGLACLSGGGNFGNIIFTDLLGTPGTCP